MFEVKSTKKKGMGLFATEDIQAGTNITAITGTPLRGEEITPEQWRQVIGHQNYLMPGPNDLWNKANHSCNPNAQLGSILYQDDLVASRLISNGEEITVGYGWITPIGTTDEYCYCEDRNCIGRINFIPVCDCEGLADNAKYNEDLIRINISDRTIRELIKLGIATNMTNVIGLLIVRMQQENGVERANELKSRIDYICRYIYGIKLDRVLKQENQLLSKRC